MACFFLGNNSSRCFDAADAAKMEAEIEVYPAAHGWCPPDGEVYDKVQAEKAWSRMLAIFGKALA